MSSSYRHPRQHRGGPGGSARRKSRRSRSLMRLVVGGFIVGVEDLMDRLERWERIIVDEPVDALPVTKTTREQADQSPEAFDVETEPLKDSVSARHVLLGLVFGTHDRLERGLAMMARIERRAGNLLFSPLESLANNRLFRPLSHRFERLVSRGEAEVARWAEIGKLEEYRSKKLALTATTETVDSSIDYLTHNEELQELIASQGSGLAMEAIEEMRERTVSADIFFENIARSLLRRKPRRYLDAPPPEVRLRAARHNSPKKER